MTTRQDHPSTSSSSHNTSAPLSHPSHITSKLLSSSPSAPFWSLEFFPPKTAQGSANLLSRISRMSSELQPSWLNVTWGAGGTTESKSLTLAGRCVQGDWDAENDPVGMDMATEWQEQQKQAGKSATDLGNGSDVCLHLTCTNVERKSLDQTLATARKLNIRNILALRGDPPRGEEYWVASDSQFQLATDLVRYIHQEHGDFFCVGVAAYPEGHCDSIERDIERDVRHLKLKQDAGAQFVITQLFYDVDVFVRWYKQCRDIGITIPILPGIMPIQNYQSFRRMTNLCKATVPEEVLAALEPIRFDDAAVKDYGVQLAIRTIARLYLETDVRGFHLCTLNLEKSVKRVLHGLGWVRQESPRSYADGFDKGPFAKLRATEGARRSGGGVNGSSSCPPRSSSPPIDYHAVAQAALRGVSYKTSKAVSDPVDPADGGATAHTAGNASRLTSDYIHNTSTSSASATTWDEFPNGRYGDARSPAFGEIDGYGVSLKVPPQDALRLWGTPTEEDDISLIFSKYLLATLACIPWCDAPIFDETLAIRKWLLALNLPRGNGKNTVNGESINHSSPSRLLCGRGWWTVGSQPAVDGVASSDPTYGFGPRDGGGYVYQKAFVEIFVDEIDKEWIRKKVDLEGQGKLSFFAGSGKGDYQSNLSPGEVDAVTWGVFPGKEIAQPTIIEEESFKAWRDEAFEIWSEWEMLFGKETKTRKLLRDVGKQKWLVTLVHHDYKDASALWRFLGCEEFLPADEDVARIEKLWSGVKA